MEDILFYLGSFVATCLFIYLGYYVIKIYNSVEAKLLRKGVPKNFIDSIKEEAIEIVKDIEIDFDEDYEHDQDGTKRHVNGRELLKNTIDFFDLSDRISSGNIDKIIEGAVEAAGLVKDKNPYKK